MATTPSKPSASKKSPAKKASSTKPAAKPAHKPAPKTKAKTPTPAAKKAPAVDVTKIANTTLNLIDQAAELLRKTVTTSADLSEKAQLQATNKAHALLEKAQGGLKLGLDTLQKFIP